MIDPTSITQVRNLDADNVGSVRILGLALLARSGRRRGFIEGDAGNFAAEEISLTGHVSFLSAEKYRAVITYADFSRCF